MIHKKQKVFYLLKEAHGGAKTFIDIFAKIRNRQLDTYIFIFERNNLRSSEFKYLNNTKSTLHPSIGRMITFVNHLFQLYQLLCREKPVVVMCGDNYTFVMLMLIKPLYLLVHKHRFYSVLRIGNKLDALIASRKPLLYRWILFLIVRLFIKKTKYYISCTKEGKRDFNVCFQPPKYSINKTIFNGINLNKAQRLAEQKIPVKDRRLFNNNVIYISIGRFEEQKDFLTIIRAFKMLYRKNHKTRLIIIGKGYQEHLIKNEIKIHGLKDSIKVIKWKKNIYPYLKKADIYIHSSRYEGFPFTLLDAMSQKLPIVSTDTPFGPREVLGKNKYGVLVPVGDYKRMSKAMERLMKNKVLKNMYAIQAYKRVQSFTEEIMKRRYERFFFHLLNKKNNET